MYSELSPVERSTKNSEEAGFSAISLTFSSSKEEVTFEESQWNTDFWVRKTTRLFCFFPLSESLIIFEA